MSELKTRIESIINDRRSRIGNLKDKGKEWQGLLMQLQDTKAKLSQAASRTPELLGSLDTLQNEIDRTSKIHKRYEDVLTRFNRNTVCIGIGGAAGTGKSTFLQAVSGLEEQQIPTSGDFCTTAVRCQIENCDEGIAIASMHSPDSFLKTVINELGSKLGIQTIYSLDELKNLDLSRITTSSQEQDDILKRLKDAQNNLSEYEHELTGAQGRRIPLSELRKYVAYPENSITKAGPYLAVKDLVIRVPFPSTDVTQLRLVDMPGIGEAGIDLAKVQTAGLSEVCDITILMKGAFANRIEWEAKDTNALDAMGNALPLLEAQTKYTLLLINASEPGRGKLCETSINSYVKRDFTKIICNARNRDEITNKTMPQILDFMARNLPEIDRMLMENLQNEGDKALKAIRKNLTDLRNTIKPFVPVIADDFTLTTDIINALSNVLTDIEEGRRNEANNTDKAWLDEIERITGVVKQWIQDGCGYGSKDNLQAAIEQEIKNRHGQPTDVINACRIGFREQWSQLDAHLEERIAELLEQIMDSMKKEVLHDFIPERNGRNKGCLTRLEDVKQQLKDLIEKVSRYSQDNPCLLSLAAPLYRIKDFELQFRYHLEPSMQAATRLTSSNNLPLVKDFHDVASFTKTLQGKLTQNAEEYSRDLKRGVSAQAASCSKIDELLSRVLPNPAIKKQLLDIIGNGTGAQTFAPNKIFAALAENFNDAMIRGKDSRQAINVLIRQYRDEITAKPDDTSRLLWDADKALSQLLSTSR